jgi:hypothetical protein
MTIDLDIFKRAGADPKRDEEAREAVRVFRGMLPNLNAYVRMLTKNPKARIELATHDNGSTNGTKIYYRPPLALGKKRTHDRALCDKRDKVTLLQRCSACAIREEILVTIYHEIAHICFDSFMPVTQKDKATIIADAIRASGSKYGKALADRIAKEPSWVVQNYISLASIISEWLPMMTNALEDARVNRELHKARPGTRIMFEADEHRIFNEGFEAIGPDGKAFTCNWNERPLNQQVLIALYAKASGYEYGSWFHESVVAAMDDSVITSLMRQMDTIRSTAGVYQLCFPTLERLRELGFCQLPDDPDLPEEEPDDSGTEGDSDESESGDSEDHSDDESSSDTGDGDESDVPPSENGTDSSDSAGDGDSDEEPDDGSESPGEGVGSDGSAGAPADPSAETGDGDSEGEGGNPLDEPGDDDRDGEGSDGEGSGEDGSSSGSGGESDSDASGEGSGADSEPTDEPGGESELGDGDDDGAGGDDAGEPEVGDTDSEGDSGSSSSGEQGDDEGEGPGESSGGGDGGADGRSDDWSDTGPEASDESAGITGTGDIDGSPVEEASHEGPGDGHGTGAESAVPGDSSTATGSEHRDDSDDELAGDGPDDSVEGDGASDGPGLEDAGLPSDEHADGDESIPEDGSESDDTIDTGESTGGVEVIENEKNDDLPMGTPEECRQGVEIFGHHDEEEKPKSVLEEEAKDDNAVKVAIVQGLYFETPSREIYGVRIHHKGSPVMVQGINMSEAFDHGRWGAALSKSQAGIKCDMEIGEEVLGPALQRMRVTFADNRRGKQVTNLKAGKVNTRVLGKRAHIGDDRLFKKKSMPGKRSYFVVIGIDVSGSTVGTNIVLAKRAAYAQAELCERMGIDFAVYAHSGNMHSPKSGRAEGVDLDIYVIKERQDPWNEERKNILRDLGPDAANLDGHSIEFYRKRLEESNATDKILMYYSDGKMPAENYEEELEILQREIRTFARKKMTLLAVGIRTEDPVEHGLDTVRVDDDADITKVVRHLEKRLVMR